MLFKFNKTIKQFLFVLCSKDYFYFRLFVTFSGKNTLGFCNSRSFSESAETQVVLSFGLFSVDIVKWNRPGPYSWKWSLKGFKKQRNRLQSTSEWKQQSNFDCKLRNSCGQKSNTIYRRTVVIVKTGIHFEMKLRLLDLNGKSVH